MGEEELTEREMNDRLEEFLDSHKSKGDFTKKVKASDIFGYKDW